MKKKYFAFRLIAVIGMVLPHSVIFLPIVFLSLFWLPLLAVFFLYLLVITAKGFFSKNRNQLKSGLAGFASLLVFFASLLISIEIVAAFSQYKVEKIISKLEDYKSQSGNYPESLKGLVIQEPFIKLKYRKDKNTNSYMISYSRDAIERIEYDSQTNEWRTLGWND